MNIENERKVEYNSINELYDTTSLAKAMGLSREMIYYYKKVGKLTGFKVSKNKELFTKEQVIELLKKEGYNIN
jgi:DNA-binding transcriptional MerR regulator